MGANDDNRQLLESMFEGETFKSPQFEYELRSDDFVAEIPQTGERFEGREALKAMQEGFGTPPAIQLKRISGAGDLWTVEAVQTYKDGSPWHVCVLVEFANGKICRETRYYAPPLETNRS